MVNKPPLANLEDLQCSSDFKSVRPSPAALTTAFDSGRRDDTAWRALDDRAAGILNNARQLGVLRPICAGICRKEDYSTVVKASVHF